MPYDTDTEMCIWWTDKWLRTTTMTDAHEWLKQPLHPLFQYSPSNNTSHDGYEVTIKWHLPESGVSPTNLYNSFIVFLSHDTLQQQIDIRQ